MGDKAKKVLAINDLCAFGKVSLNVTIPILATMGVQTCPLPTMILSTHTDGYGCPYTLDLSASHYPILEHLQQSDIKFDSVYSGYMANKKQVSIVREIIKSQSAKLKLVDPVMGDNGEYYTFFNGCYLQEVKRLIAEAYIITPNITEAFLLLGKEYKVTSLETATLKEYLKHLADIGPRYVVVTSVVFEDGKYGNVAYDKDTNRFFKINFNHYPVTYPGTGDIFASVMLGCLLSQDDIKEALGISTLFCESSVKHTFFQGSDIREGIHFERELHRLNSKSLISLAEEF